MNARRLLALASLATASFAASAQVEMFFYPRDGALAAFTEAIQRQREDASVREALTRRYGDFQTAYKRGYGAPEPVGPTSWRAESQSPWANAYGTPSSGVYGATTMRTYPTVTARYCACYIPADAKSWDGGPLTEADIARRCKQQCP